MNSLKIELACNVFLNYSLKDLNFHVINIVRSNVAITILLKLSFGFNFNILEEKKINPEAHNTPRKPKKLDTAMF